MEETYSEAEAEQSGDRGGAASAHAQALRSASDLNRRLRAFEARMLEQFEQLARELDGGEGTICAEAAEIERQLAICEAPLAAPRDEQGADDDRDRELADLRQRYEMAVSDIRDLKKQLVEAESNGRATAAAVPSAPAPASGPLDWEAQKRRLLASLESEAEESPEPDEERAEERLQIDQVIRVTEATLRNKQAEIDELRERLESAAISATRADASAALDAAQLDASDVIQAELARLQSLEEALQGSLRQAEIELSVERAHLARVAAELDEKQRGITEQLGNHPTAPHHEAAGKPKKPQHKWLARLGLNEEAKG